MSSLSKSGLIQVDPAVAPGDKRICLPPGKRGVVVYSQGGGDDRAVFESLASFLAGALGIEVKGIVGGNGMNEPGAVRRRKELMEEAFRLGRELAG